MAEDTGGEAVAGPYYDAAEASFTMLIDTRHTVSSLYNMLNVPTAVLINEAGVIVRQDEGVYTRTYQFGELSFGTDDYLPALHDWVAKGNDSKYALQPDEVAAGFRQRTPDEALADANFRLAVHLHLLGNSGLANRYWETAQRLHPDSWNYHRQDWSFTPDEAGANWFAKFRALDKPYYRPLNLPEPDTDP